MIDYLPRSSIAKILFIVKCIDNECASENEK